MKKLLFTMCLILACASIAQAHDVTIAVTKSLDDPTPRTSVFPSVTINGVVYPSTFKHYQVEQNGVILPLTCASGCPSLTIQGLADGTYSYRMGAVVESTRAGVGGVPTKVLSTGWSAIKTITILCGVAVPDAPELGAAAQVCK